MILNFFSYRPNNVDEDINIGDWVCAPGRYFDFNQPIKLCCITEVTSLESLQKYDPGCHVIIGGGGINEPKWLPSYKLIIKYFTGHKFIWGTGGKIIMIHNLTKHFDLIGIRDYHFYLEYKHLPNISYLPCASCMSPLFDKVLQNSDKSKSAILYGSKKKPDRKFNTKLLNKYPLITNRGTNYEEKLMEIHKHRKVITNSYHGFYWGILLGKKPYKTIKLYPSIYDANVNPEIKDITFDTFDDKVNYIIPKRENRTPKSKEIFYLEYKTVGLTYSYDYKNALEDSRRLNKKFYQKIMALLYPTPLNEKSNET